jgi:hypothetical protein
MRYCWLFFPQRDTKGHEEIKNLGLLRVLRGYLSKTMFIIILVLLTSCAAAQPLPVDQAQTRVRHSWQTGQHVVWVVDWPAAPVGGPVTVETWRAGDSFRYEILESVAPALIGEMIVFNGQIGWQANRFDPGPPLEIDSPRLSPLSDAFAMIDRLVTALPQSASQEAGQTIHGPAQKISLSYAAGQQLTFWLDNKTQLPVRIQFVAAGTEATLNARDFEPLSDPPRALFEFR